MSPGTVCLAIPWDDHPIANGTDSRIGYPRKYLLVGEASGNSLQWGGLRPNPYEDG
jgi:hypothetical protein